MRRALTAILAVTLSIAAHAQSANEQLIYSFCAQTNCADGAFPNSGMALLSNGSFVAATPGGGDVYPNGSIVMFTPTGQGYDYSADVLAGFCYGPPSTCPGGFAPTGTPIESLNSNLYFANYFGGNASTELAYGAGVLWQYSPPYGLSILEQELFLFCSDTNCAAGGRPSSGLIQGSDGALYGATSIIGGAGFGAIYRIDPSSSNVTVLHSFCSAQDCNDGEFSAYPLLQAADGNFYGTTFLDGANNGGVVFQLTPTGNYTVLHSFCSPNDTSCPDGRNPVGSLVQADNGNIYGVTSGGGNSSDGGTIFYIDTSGTFHTYVDFGCILEGTACVNGYTPGGGLIFGSDGNLYGTTTVTSTKLGGSPYGAAFQLPLNLTNSPATNILYYCAGGMPCLNGSNPAGELVIGADANLYGVFNQGGIYGEGAAYLLTTSSWLRAPVQLSLSASSVAANTPVTLSWKVPYAYSKTAQLCGAFVQNFPAGSGIWTGLQTGTYANHAYSGSSVITPTSAGTYTYALTCGGKESGFATLTVTESDKSSTTTALAVSPNPITVGQAATLKATVTSSAGTPTGNVSFYYGSDELTTVSVNSGVASFTASTNGLPPGTYALTAEYSGDSSHDSSSGTDSAKLGQAATATTLTVSPESVTRPADVTLSVAVKRDASGVAGTPTGSVTFYANGTDALTTVKLNSSGVASITASSKGYPAGKYAITAKYLGDSSDTTSTSAAVDITLK